MKRSFSVAGAGLFAFVLLMAGLAVPHNAFADKPPDTVKTFVWGDSHYGQLGTGMTGVATTPVAVDDHAAGRFTDLATGDTHSCALDGHGHAYCWGRSVSGELGNASATSSNVPVPVDTSGVLAGKQLVDIAAGAWFSCALDSEGQAYCWGNGVYGELGNGGTTNSPLPVAVDMSGVLSGRALTQIKAGGLSACALDCDGQAFCWGQNAFGQLGNGTTAQSSVPVAVDTTGLLNGVVLLEVGMGNGHVCAVDDRGKAYCWQQLQR